MGDCILIVLLAAILVLGVISSVKHFKGESGCCGGGGRNRPKKKRLSNMKYRKIFRIGGMHCAHCGRRVEDAVNGVKDVAGKVNLKKGELTVFCADDVDDEILKSKIRQAGYTVEEAQNPITKNESFA
ncbi:MAG: heavy-metal-associated domain-containing protein [Clostridia bacterium]|nr:heavy-metal-associated domain-containing protein [Clostridia bacterium]